MKKLLPVVSLFFLLFFCSFNLYQDDNSNDINNLIKTANTKELSKYFSNSVQFDILGNEEPYNKHEAEITLKDFFAKHNPSAVKLVHRLTSSANFRFVVLELTTNTGIFRFSYAMKNNNNQFEITQIRVQTNKD